MPNVMRGGMWYVVDDDGGMVDDNEGHGYASRDLIPTGHTSFVNKQPLSMGGVVQVDETGLAKGVPVQDAVAPVEGDRMRGLDVFKVEDTAEEPESEIDLPFTDDEAELEPDAVEAPTEVPERLADIVGAINSMDRADTSLWNADESPSVEAIEGRLGYDISAAERDAAWVEVLNVEVDGDGE